MGKKNSRANKILRLSQTSFSILFLRGLKQKKKITNRNDFTNIRSFRLCQNKQQEQFLLHSAGKTGSREALATLVNIYLTSRRRNVTP